MFEKYIDLSVDSVGFGPGVQAVHPSVLNKFASECYTPKTLIEIMGDLKPREDGVYVLLNALGAGEYIGKNRNGDFFPEWSLRGDEPPKRVVNLMKTAGREIPGPDEYGYKTFVTDANLFVGHDNKDPQKCVGKVIASAYNDKMHRVELVAFIDGTKQAEAVDRVKNGDQIPFSMGARLKEDFCGVCLNAARTRNDYCDHLKYAMNQTLPDGRSVYAYNFFPKFFDISIVRTPADPTAWSLKKVASASGPLTQPVFIGDPNHYKLSSMLKTVPGSDGNVLNANKKVNPKLVAFTQKSAKKLVKRKTNPKIIRGIKKHGSAILANLTALGIILNNEEAQLLYSKSDCPSTFDVARINPSIVRELSDVVKEASFFDPHFTSRSLNSTESDSGASLPAAYVNYLKSINFEQFTHRVETDPVVMMSLDVETCLNKVAGFNDNPVWLPFVVGITIL